VGRERYGSAPLLALQPAAASSSCQSQSQSQSQSRSTPTVRSAHLVHRLLVWVFIAHLPTQKKENYKKKKGKTGPRLVQPKEVRCSTYILRCSGNGNMRSVLCFLARNPSQPPTVGYLLTVTALGSWPGGTSLQFQLQLFSYNLVVSGENTSSNSVQYLNGFT
jgi:hypothetical protein